MSGWSLVDTESCEGTNQGNGDPAWGEALRPSDASSHLVPLDQPVCAVEVPDGRTSDGQLLPHCGRYWEGEFPHVCSWPFVDAQPDAPGYTVGLVSAPTWEKTSDLKHIMAAARPGVVERT